MAEAEKTQAPTQAQAQDDTATQRQVIERTVVREVREPVNGPNMATDPENPEDHFFTVNGKNVNAFGEEKGSPEDKKRFS